MNLYGQDYEQQGSTPSYGAVSQGGQMPPYMVPFSPPAPPPGPRSPRAGRIVGIVVAVLLVLGVGVAYGVSTYAESEICEGIKTATEKAAAGATGRGAGAPDSAEEAQRQLTSASKLLLFHSDLQKAMESLSADIGRIKEAEKNGTEEAGFAEMISALQSMDAHFRQAQEACGHPADGILKKAFEAAAAGA